MAGSINLANVALGFDSSKITKGVDLSAGELRKLTGIVKSSESGMDKYNRELGILEKAYAKGAVSADRMAQATQHLQNIHKQGSGGTSAGSVTGDLKSTLAQYAGMAAAFQGVKSSLSLAATAESNRISLEVLTGSAAKAKFLFDGFIELDRSSPLSRQDFSKAAQTLIGYGVAAESTLPALKQLSEISIGNADRFQSLSLAFGQVQAQGRLMGQEVLQMVNAGFNPLQEISRTTGRSMVDLKKDMENGAISASMVADALQSATSEGGRFYEMNEKLKNSAAGQYAKMQSDVQLLATEIGTKLLPAAKAFMDLLNTGSDGKGGGGILSQLAGDFSTGAQGIMAIGSDAFTNLDGSSKGTQFASLQDRIQTEQMTAQMQKEFLHVNTKEENERIQKNMAARAAKERAEMQESADEQKRLQEKADEELNEAKKQFEEHARKLDQEEKDKAISAEFKRREAKILTEAGLKRDKLQRDGQGGVTENSAPSLRAGSVEAYKFLLAQKDRLSELNEKMLTTQEDIRDTMHEQLNELKSQAKFTKAR